MQTEAGPDLSVPMHRVSVKCVHAPDICSFVETVEAPAAVAEKAPLATYLPESALGEWCPKCGAPLVKIDELPDGGR